MSQTGHGDLEGSGDIDGHHNQHHSTPNQLLWSSQESEFRESAWPLYSIYSNIADDEINKMVERCQRNTNGILIFSGLFSATIGALLTVSIPDLKPNSQDTSAFYLKNIYQVFGNPNVSHPSTPFALAEPPAFSPPRYAIWVNLLWFLSLALSLSCAMWATMAQKWVVHYFETTRRPWDTPVKRARIRAFFSKGDPGPYTHWGVNDFSGYLHTSVLLFIIGGLIYLFNINHPAFYAVVSWVGYMAMSYTYATVQVFVEPHNLLHTPFSRPALRIYLGISYVVFQVCSCIPPLHDFSHNTRRRYYDLSNHYKEGILFGKWKTANEYTSNPSSEIDDLILKRILLTLDEDHAMEMFFDAIPGFCNSKLSIQPLPFLVRTKLRPALDGFLDRTFSSSLVPESVRASRLITCLNAAHAALEPGVVPQILCDIIEGRWVEALQSVEIGHALRFWGHRRDHDQNLQWIVACIIARAQRRDDRWTMLVKETFGVPDRVLQDSLAHRDSVLLFILIHISRQANRAGSWTSGILSSHFKFDICNTLPGLQDDFRTLWDEIAQEAKNQELSSVPAQILSEIRHLHVALHGGTDAALTAFSGCRAVPSLTQPEKSPAASPHHTSLIESDHTPDGSATSQQAVEVNIIVEPPSPTEHTPLPSHTQGFTPPPLATNFVHITQATPVAGPSLSESIGTAIAWNPDRLVLSEASHDPRRSTPSAAEIADTEFVGSGDRTTQTHTSETSQALVAPLFSQHRNPVQPTFTPSTGPDPGDSPDALVQGTTSSATLSHPLQGNMQQATVAPCAAPDTGEIPSMVNPIPPTTPTVSAASPTIDDSPSSPTLLPAHFNGMTTAESPSFVESAPIQPDHIPNALRSPSSSLTTANSLDTHDLNPPISMTVLSLSDWTAPIAHNTSAAPLKLEDQAQHDLEQL
ncbi:hypothetical protein DFH94DRAFT_38235 [Russula ochroleuca]|uniref:DUF6535 domain-containing protein n=1 Tax=Russula ochroleuca TaxID=152965 RepID=A0A9P5MUI0_9AGAM|nr:hypothetical protein DFH94DRAFT_38235 [Russula ochroleuca]